MDSNAAGKTIRDPVGAASGEDREVQAVRVRALVVPADREETHRSAVPSVVQDQAGDPLRRKRPAPGGDNDPFPTPRIRMNALQDVRRACVYNVAIRS